MKFKILPSLFTYFLLFFAANAKAQGGVLPLNSSKTGNITSATPDIYTITTTSDGLLRLTFTTVSPADLYLTLYDNDGTTALSGQVESFNNSTVTIVADGLAAGTYKAQIIPANTSYGAYTLSDSLFTSGITNDVEPNGSAAAALVVPQNGSMTGHVGYYYNHSRDTADWYKVTTTSNGLLRVYLKTDSGSKYSTTSTNPLDVNLTLYDNDGITQLQTLEVFNGYVPAMGAITQDGLAPGTYYIKIENYTVGTEFANYKISDSLFTATLANDVEPNGTAATALTLPLNSSKTGNVGYYYNHTRDTADWYKVTTTSNGLLRVYLTTDSASKYSNTGTNPLDVNVYLYDGDGATQLGYVEVYSGYAPTSNLITKDGLAPGTYYIKVENFTPNTEFANYKVSDSLFTATLPNDLEPNGTTATAVALPLNSSKTGNVGYYYNNTRDTADWYKVTTTADGLLRLYLTTDSASKYSNVNTDPLDVNLTLYDNNGTTQLSTVEVYNGYTPATNQINLDGLQAGTYYIKVENFTPNTEFANYSITDSLIPSTIKNDTEYNGTPATALAFPPGSTTKGHVGYYYNNQRDTSDWYKLTTVTAGPLYVYLSSLRGNTYSNSTNNPLDMLLYLYGSDGTTQLGSVEVYNGYNPAVDSLFFSNLAAGTYYVKVTNYSPNTEFANYSLTNSASPGALLPVSFISFDGVLNGDRANLTWSTATELNNTGFDVQKSSDGQTFSTIGFVKGNGNSSVVNNYNYTDIKVLSGYNYYRLKQLDIDGNFNYSSIIRLDFSKFDWAVFGNPVTSNSWIQLQVAKTSKVAIQILTVDGRIMKTINKGTLSMGTYSYPLSLGNVPSGMYIVRLITDNGIFSKKIVK